MLHIYFFLTLLFFAIFSSEAHSGNINLGPLYHSLINSDYEKEFTALGPFIFYKKSKEHIEYGFRPFYHKTIKKREGVEEFEFIYPLASYKKKENLSWFQAQLFLLVYDTETTNSGYKNKKINFFPFIFYNNEENKKNNYFAFLPFYGNLKNKFAKDNIRFLFFPLYMKTEVDGEVTKSIMWPFISFYSEQLEGVRFWPLVGKRTNKNKGSYREFLLWPIYVKKEREFYGEKFYFKSIFPVYSNSYFHGVSRRGYFWPFIQHTVNHNRGNERWDVPWPFFSITKGRKDNQTKIFPFYSRAERNERDEDGYILWPVYKYSNVDLASYRRYKKSFFLFLYKDIKEEPLIDGIKLKRKIDFWPIFTYEKDASGNKIFHIFTIFEPFIHSNDRLYRNYASFWRVFVWEKSNDNVTRSSLLWNLVSLYKNHNRFIFDVRPIIPLFNYSRHEVNRSWNILGGFIGYAAKDKKNILKLLYIPIKI